MSAYPKLKLTYFPLPGRAEAVRLAFFIGGVPFFDERLAYENFGPHKPTFPYGQVPALEIDGEVLAQSQAILRYAGRLAKLYPSNNALAALKIDEVLGAIDELQEKIMPSLFENDPEKKKEMRKELAEVTIPRYLSLIEARLAKQLQSPIFQTQQIFIHHLTIYSITEWLKSGHLDHVPITIADGYKLWNDAHDRVANHPKVKEWYVSLKDNTQPKLKLTYFPRAGRAEPIRLAFHIGGIEFEDERINAEELQQRKPSLPFNQIPVLEVNGEVIAQSLPILRYAGTLAGLYPVNDPVAALRIDELFGVIDELHNVWGPSFREQDEAKRMAMRKELADVTIPKYLGFLDKRLGMWETAYAAGPELTIADLAIFGLVNALKSGHMVGVPVSVVDPFTRVGRVFDKVLEHPKVVEWYQTHER